MFRLLLCSWILFFLVFPALSVSAADIHVPVDFPTIQGAIDASIDGDRIIVAAGTYIESIDFLGKTIQVTSQDGAETTVVDNPLQDTIVTFAHGEGRDTLLQGFTIRNGSGNLSGGILCTAGSSPTISHNRIIGNESFLHGGGVACVGSSPLLMNNMISDNRGSWWNNSFGIYCEDGAAPVIVNNLIINNGIDDFGEEGGGIYCLKSSPIITNNTICGNRGAAGIITEKATANVTNCIIWANGKQSILNLYEPMPARVTYSCLQHRYPGRGNTFQHPYLIAPGTGNAGIMSFSPCKNTGTRTAPALPDKDYYGNPRILDGNVDMGAAECAVIHGPPRTYTVPGDFALIQDALEHALPLDTIRVGPGTYTQPLVFNGKTIKLISTGGPLVTTIRGAMKQPAISMVHGEGPETVVEGFTIMDGKRHGGIHSFCAYPTIRNNVIAHNLGYGIKGPGSFLTVIDNIIYRNELGNDFEAGGIYNDMELVAIGNTITENTYRGGIHLRGGRSAIIRDNIITHNSSRENGGGICCWLYSQEESDTQIIGNTIRGNSMESSYGLSGGGIFYSGSLSSASLLIAHNTITDNSVNTHSYSASARGGGISCSGGSITITANTILRNTLNAEYGESYGAGICAMNSSAIADPVLIANNVIAENRLNGCEGHGGGIFCRGWEYQIIGNRILANQCLAQYDNWGGGLYFQECPAGFIANNSLIGNEVTALHTAAGGGIFCQDSTVSFFNNTLAANRATEGGGLFIDATSHPMVCNSIFWNDSPDEIVTENGAIASVTYSCIEDDYFGEGNIDTYPVFKDTGNGDYRLKRTSPCINRGINQGAPAMDWEGDPRPGMGSVDMGWDEYQGLHLLAAPWFSVSRHRGGSIPLTLYAGTDHGGSGYCLFGTRSGTAPGEKLPASATILPVNFDSFTDLVLNHLNTPCCLGFLGVLDPMGQGTAVLTIPPRTLPLGWVGSDMGFAFAVETYDLASNPISITVVP